MNCELKLKKKLSVRLNFQGLCYYRYCWLEVGVRQLQDSAQSLVLMQTTLFSCKEHPQWCVSVGVAWTLSPLCRQTLLMSSMAPWKTWSGFKPSQTWPKKLHFWSSDNHLCCIRLVTHQLNYSFVGVFWGGFFHLQNTKTKSFQFSPISQDLVAFIFFLKTSHFTLQCLLCVVYFAAYLAVPRYSAVFSLGVLETF